MEIQSVSVERRRGSIVLYEYNPFVMDVKTRARKVYFRQPNMKFVNVDTGMQNPVAGFWTNQLVDKGKFVKLYINGVKALAELTPAGTKVFEVVYLKMQDLIEKDKIHMSFTSVNQDITPMSRATYKRGLTEMIAKGFLAASPEIGLYWINPDFMFNGDRLAIVQQYFKVGSPAGEAYRKKLIEEERRAKQMDLPFFNEPETFDESLDFTYSPELEAQDSYFDRATQAELVRRAKNMEAGINCIEHEIIETD